MNECHQAVFILSMIFAVGVTVPVPVVFMIFVLATSCAHNAFSMLVLHVVIVKMGRKNSSLII